MQKKPFKNRVTVKSEAEGLLPNYFDEFSTRHHEFEQNSKLKLV